jgi:hypothetical protein
MWLAACKLAMTSLFYGNGSVLYFMNVLVPNAMLIICAMLFLGCLQLISIYDYIHVIKVNFTNIVQKRVIRVKPCSRRVHGLNAT